MSNRLGHKKVSDFIEFRDMGYSESGKTKVWYVVNTSNPDDVPGIIKWNGAWRKYVYHSHQAFYDWECLRLIADFIEKVTLEHRNAKKTD